LLSGRRLSVSLAFALLLVALPALPAHAATSLYPDLKTLPPRDLRFDRTDVSADGSGQLHNVLRFSNTVWNAGPGKLEMRGQIDPNTKTGPATERVYDDAGGFTDLAAGSFYFHPVHNHYHYDDWGRYQLWTKPEYDAWIASGRTQGSADDFGVKTTSCIVDEEFIRDLPGTPYPPLYPSDGCFPNSSGLMVQGIGTGWGDTYDYWRFEQWVDLNQGSLPDGQYVLRSVTDPTNKVYESANKADTSREGQVDNEATTTFSIQGGNLVDSNPPSGSVRVNDVDSGTSSPNVTVKVLGRDDVSGVTQVRLSNDGSQWSTPQAYTGSGSTAQAISWDLTNATYGGNNSDGMKTVYAQFKDAAGKWSSSETDTIVLDRGGGSSAYSNAVKADSPVGFWRLGELSGASAVDSVGSNNGTYSNGPLLGQTSLLAGDAASKSVRFDGVNDYVSVPNSSSLGPTARVSVEAWIKPEALPAAGSFASIATKAEAYSLQFNGPRLEFTIMQSGVRKRVQAANGAVQTGQTYHVVGTYDGVTQRLYINGSEVANTPLTGAIGSNANGLYVASWSGGSEQLKGTVDEVAVYPTNLAASRVAAHYQAGSGAPPPNPTVAAPTNLAANAVSSSQLNLQWTDNSSNETEFLIERDTNSNFTSPVIKNAFTNATSYSDTGLSPSTTYYYRVKARNATDSSGYSNTANATTSAAPPPPTGYAAAVAADNPVSHWRLGETSGSSAADQKGANPGVYLNAPTLGAASLLGSDTANKAVGFDGANDEVSVANSPTLNLSSPVTLEAWIKPTALPAAGSFASVLTKAESYSLQFNGPRLEFTIMQFGVRKRLQAPSGAIQTGTGYHVVGTHDGTTQRLYVNGTEVANAPLSGGATSSSSGLFIGSWDGGMEFMSGTIDEAAVYGSTLSASRVGAHYTAGSGVTPPVAAPSNLSATAASTSQINLQWTDNASNETEYVVERDTNSNFTAPQSTTLGANATSYSSTGLSPSTTYYYRVKARNASASSAYSGSASATTQSPPPPPPTGYAAAVAADNPVSHWRLGETSGSSALDQKSANPGVYLNAPTLGATSLLGSDTANKAVAFDGVNDQVRIANSSSLSLSSPITLEAWIKPTTLPAAGSFASVVTKPETYSLQFNGPRLEFTIMQFGVRKRLQAASGAILAGQTYHVVGTYDGTTQRLYVNGAQVASVALTGGATSSSNGVFIGSWDGGSEFLKGTVDEVAVYGATLSAARALAHYNAGK
jgi:concanavalin A-like lectin/glucanase superfamily protein/fibronectin type III domain protein